jgi:hypothetical protein
MPIHCTKAARSLKPRWTNLILQWVNLEYGNAAVEEDKQ